MRVSLVTQHCVSAFIPLALLYLKASLVERGRCPQDTVDVVEFDRDASSSTVVSRILETEPDVVGFSCYVWNVTTLMAAAREMKARRPQTRIVFGGPEVGPVADAVLRRHPSIDVIVKSEGEIPLVEMQQAWAARRDLSNVKGICYRRGEEIVDTGEAPLLKDIDELPSPHLHRYGDVGKRVICVETQRGCVFRCNFCFYNKDFSLRNRRFELDRVKQELRYWLDQDVLEIYLMDPVFNLNPARTKEICRFIAEHNHRRTRLHAEIWAEFVDDEMAQLMRDANFQFLEVGLQTTDTTALATVERRLKLQKFVDGVGHLKEHGLPFELQLIYGLPGETRASFARSLNFAISLDPSDLEVFPLMVLPGTELARNAAALKLTFDPEPPYYARSHRSMTTEDFDYGRRLIAACTHLQKSRTVRLLAKERGLSFSAILDEWIQWQDREGTDTTDREAITRFVSELCAARTIPAGFYDRFARLEWGA